MRDRRSLGVALGLSGGPPSLWLGLFASPVVVAIGTGVVYPIKSDAPAVSLAVVYLPGIMLVSIVWGWKLGLIPSVASALAFNFFHLPPLHRLTLADEQNWVALATFAIAAILSSAVASLARSRAIELDERRQEADRALAELTALTEERDRMRAEAVEAEAFRRSDELKTALLRSISHDLRTPLTSIIAGGTALGAEHLTATERTELSGAIVGEGKRLARLVENPLDMSRLEAGRAKPHRELTDLAALLGMARGAALDPGRIKLWLDSELPLIDADAAQLERAFEDLPDNALRHGGGRSVSVRSRLVGDAAVVRVVDQGPGIPEREWARIFEPFRQGGDANGDPGSGLGLAIVKGFVEANGGGVAVESMPGQGTSFGVTFPVAAEPSGGAL